MSHRRGHHISWFRSGTIAPANPWEDPVNVSLLSTLIRHSNQLTTRDQLIYLAFNDDFGGFDRAIDNQIARLRKQISRNGKQPIQTVYGGGYRFVVENE